MIVELRWETPEEKDAVERALLDWTLYGELHLTNAHGVTVLDPAGVTYKPTGREVRPTEAADPA